MKQPLLHHHVLLGWKHAESTYLWQLNKKQINCFVHLVCTKVFNQKGFFSFQLKGDLVIGPLLCN